MLEIIAAMTFEDKFQLCMYVFFLRSQTHCLLDPATVEAASDLDDDDEVWEDESSDSVEEFN